ncbi:MAG: LysR family transcriptional regulator [Desulfovibrionaceae bacterium]|nr:LysR family transcriptional regulator [Desulfovibrionaceae bacterium]MBF0514376.1 LysR family transcriptional regulator [Desulfovibrionaceae bacterium]
MDFRRLEAFCKVYENRGFSKAGQALFLSQPTISAHVSSLEEELATPLFDRLGRAILPTKAGDILYGHCQEVFARLREAKAEIEALRAHVGGDLDLGASTIPAHYIVPGILAGFLARYPAVKVRLHLGDSRRITEQVKEGALTLGVVGAKYDDQDLVHTPVMRDELIVIASPKLLASRGVDPAGAALSLEEALNWPWVMREQGSGTRKAFEAALAPAGCDLRRLHVAVEVASNETVLHCARGSMGLAVTSRLAAAMFLASGELAPVHFPKLRFEREFYVVHHGKRHLFPAAKLLIEAAVATG